MHTNAPSRALPVAATGVSSRRAKSSATQERAHATNVAAVDESPTVGGRGALSAVERVSEPHVREDAWELTRALSPRAAVRAYTATGVESRRGLRTAPDGPWAMYLAEALPGRDAGYAYRFLGFDFDAHTDAHDHTTRRQLVLDDVATLVDLLGRVGIDHVVCRSSSSGGYHVWVAMAEALSPRLADTLGHALNAGSRDPWEPLLPTLDRGMLSNPKMGCLRPPLSPHRDGSRSELAAGTLTTLLQPTTTVAHVIALIDELRPMLTFAQERQHVPGSADLTGPIAIAPATRAQTHGRLPLDAHGHPYIPGAARPLPPAAAAALATPVGITDDASRILASILTGAARAHWRYGAVAALVDTAPGLERVRTMRHGDRRVPRPSTGWDSPSAVLAADWAACVRHVASTPTRPHAADGDYEARLAIVTRTVEHVEARARATQGRWARRGGATERRVLTQLCVYALAAARVDIEADVRRLGDDTGLPKSTVDDALNRLERDGWIAKTAEAEGPRATRWTIDPQNVLHREATTHRTQVASAAARARPLLQTLRTRTKLAAHDVFTPRALGYEAGNLYAQLLEDGTLPTAAGEGPRRLLQHGLALRLGHRLQPGPDRRDAIARAIGTTGLLQQRRRTHALERQLWAWWLDELDWMNSTQAERRARRRTHPPMPRARGRVRFDRAAAMLRQRGLAAPIDTVDELLAA